MGSLHNLAPVKSTDRSAFLIAGSFGIGAAGAVDADDIKGDGFTVTRTGTGVYRLQLTRRLFDIHNVQANIEEAAASPNVAKVAAVDVANRRVDLRITDVSAAGAAADPANGDRVHFRVHCVSSQAR